MAILKLKEAGEEATLDITGAAIVAGQYGEQIQFDAGEDRLYIPLSSAERQLERIGMANGKNIDFAEIIGQRLTFSRAASNKPGVNYWNINIAAKNGSAPKTNGTPPVAKSNEKKPVSRSNVSNADLPEFLKDAEVEDAAELAAKLTGVDTSKLEKDLALYLSISEWVVKNVGPIYADGIGWSPESATAAVATIFIQAKRNQ